MPKRSLTDQLDQAIERMLARPHGELPEVDGSLAPLLQIARQLRDLPRENFKPSLKSDLERTLSMATARQPIAAVRTFASPRLSYKSAAKAIEPLQRRDSGTVARQYDNQCARRRRLR